MSYLLPVISIILCTGASSSLSSVIDAGPSRQDRVRGMTGDLWLLVVISNSTLKQHLSPTGVCYYRLAWILVLGGIWLSAGPVLYKYAADLY